MKNMSSMIRFGALWLILISVSTSVLSAQQTVIDRRYKDYSLDDGMYPYDLFDAETAAYAAAHPVALSVGEAGFIYVHPPRLGRFQTRQLVRFDLAGEEVWENKFDLEPEAYIFHFYLAGDTAYILIGRYRSQLDIHEISVRKLDVEDGSLGDMEILWNIPGKLRAPIGFAHSPQKDHFLLYYVPGKARNDARFLLNNFYPGTRISDANEVQFRTFNQNLRLQETDTLSLQLKADNAASLVDVAIDDAGNVMTSVFKEPHTLRVSMWRPTTRLTTTLSYDEFPEPWDNQKPYMAYMPPVIGLPGKVHIAHAIRKRNRGRWETQGFKMVTYDFQDSTVHDRFQADITPSLIVEIGKARQMVGMKASPRLGDYLIREVIPLPNGDVWILAQNFFAGSQNRFESGQVSVMDFQIKGEEMILIGFDAQGKPKGALIVPLRHVANTDRGAVSTTPQVHVHPGGEYLDLMTWEALGERTRGPERIYFRRVNLVTGDITPRTKLYDSKRRMQYILPAYTCWINPFLAATLMVEGETDRHPRLVVLRLPD